MFKRFSHLSCVKAQKAGVCQEQVASWRKATLYCDFCPNGMMLYWVRKQLLTLLSPQRRAFKDPCHVESCKHPRNHGGWNMQPIHIVPLLHMDSGRTFLFKAIEQLHWLNLFNGTYYWALGRTVRALVKHLGSKPMHVYVYIVYIYIHTYIHYIHLKWKKNVPFEHEYLEKCAAKIRVLRA